MIKTLKSELKLRPTYDEMIGMIESQGDPNRPTIEQVIDRRATLFRNNQFGSQFDNIDFLGLKKQEEDRARENLRQAQLTHAGINTGTSTGMRDIEDMRNFRKRLGFETPSGTELDDPDEMDMFYAKVENFSQQRKEREQKAIEIINASILGDTERYREMVRQQQFEISEMAKNDLADVHGQGLPAGVPVHSMDVPVTTNQGYPPPLPPPPLQEEEEEEEDSGDLTNRFGLIGEFDPDKLLDDQNIKSTGLMFQLFVRGLLSDEMIELTDRLPNEEKKKRYLVSIIEGLKETDEWQQTGFSGKRVKQEVKKFRDMRRNIRNKPKTQEVTQEASSSSTPLRDIAISGAKVGVETLAKAGATAIAKSFLPT